MTDNRQASLGDTLTVLGRSVEGRSVIIGNLIWQEFATDGQLFDSDPNLGNLRKLMTDTNFRALVS